MVETVERESGLAETIYRFNFVAVVHGHAYGGRYNGKTPRGTPVYNAVAHVEQPRQPLVLVRGVNSGHSNGYNQPPYHIRRSNLSRRTNSW